MQPGKMYRFRVTCASMTFAFRLSVDGHLLQVVASDGARLEPASVESIVVYGGERYDFLLHANDQNSHEGSYWIRAETLEMYRDGKVGSELHDDD